MARLIRSQPKSAGLTETLIAKVEAFFPIPARYAIGNVRRFGAAGLILCLITGVVLRTIWPEVMEYKADEQSLFTKCISVGRTEPLPITTGIADLRLGFSEPPLSLLAWVGLARVAGVTQPTDLASAIHWLNIGALLLLAAFALWGTRPAEREPWLWATALAAVNPFAILFQRKIWDPSILPLFLVLMLICWEKRERAGPAFCWGALSLIVMQLYLPGFFLAAGFLVWTLIFDRTRMNWRGWFAGSCLGGIGLLPWFYYLLFTFAQHPVVRTKWPRFFPVQYWIHWITEPFGLGLEYSLGRNFVDFLRWPLVHGTATYIVGIAHLVLLAIGATILVRAAIRLARNLRSGRSPWQMLRTPALQSVYAACFGYGGLLTLSCTGYYRHYLTLAFPFPFVWAAYLALHAQDRDAKFKRTGRWLLVIVIVSEVIVSACFWYYLHAHPQGVEGGFSQPALRQ
jgi:hypothetical protein